MIRLEEIATKLNEVLNSTNNPLRIEGQRVAFMVATEGFRIDSVADRQLGKNLIPVFIGASGGENNPVEGLNQQTKSVNIAIWYPIVYKEIFYALEDYLDNVFVGKMVNLGTNTGNCLTNLGTAQFGEITQNNLNEFEKTANNTYEKTVDVTTNWYSMVLTLFATKMSSGFMFGNEIKYALKLAYYEPNLGNAKYNNKYYARYVLADQEVSGKDYYCWRRDEGGGNYSYIYTTLDPYPMGNIIDYLALKNTLDVYLKVDDKFVLQEEKLTSVAYSKSSTIAYEEEIIVRADAGTGAQISPIAEQRIGVDNCAKNVANITNYNKSIVIYPNMSQTLWKLILFFYNIQDLSYISFCNLKKRYSNGYEFDFKQIALGYNENGELGSPVSFTITFGDSK